MFIKLWWSFYMPLIQKYFSKFVPENKKSGKGLHNCNPYEKTLSLKLKSK